MSCHNRLGARAVPDDVQGGYRACPCCVIEAAVTSVCSNTEDDTAPAA